MDNCRERQEQKHHLKSQQNFKSQSKDFRPTLKKWRLKPTTKAHEAASNPGGFDISAYLEKYGSSAELVIGVNGKPSSDQYFQNYVQKCREALVRGEENGTNSKNISCRHPSAASATVAHSHLTPPRSQLTLSCSQLTSSCYQLTPSCTELTPSCSQLTSSCTKLTPPCSQLTPPCSQLTSSCTKLTPPCSQLTLHETESADILLMMSLGLQQLTRWAHVGDTTTTTTIKGFPPSNKDPCPPEDDLSSYVHYLMRTLKAPVKGTHLGVWLKAKAVPVSLDLAVTNVASLQVRVASSEVKVTSSLQDEMMSSRQKLIPKDKVVPHRRTVTFMHQKAERVGRDLYVTFVDLDITEDCNALKVVVTNHQSKAVLAAAVLQIQIAEFHTVTPPCADQCGDESVMDRHAHVKEAWALPSTSNGPKLVPMQSVDLSTARTQCSALGRRGMSREYPSSCIGPQTEQGTRLKARGKGDWTCGDDCRGNGVMYERLSHRAEGPNRCHGEDQARQLKFKTKNERGVFVMLSWGQVCLMKWSQVYCSILDGTTGPQTSQVTFSPLHLASDICTGPQPSVHGDVHHRVQGELPLSKGGLPLSKLLKTLDKPVECNHLGVWLRLPPNSPSNHRITSYDILVTNKTIPGNSTLVFTDHMPDHVMKNMCVLLVQLDHTHIMHDHVIEVAVKPHRLRLVMFTVSVKLPHSTPGHGPQPPMEDRGESPSHDEGDEDRTDLGALIQQFPDLQLL